MMLGLLCTGSAALAQSEDEASNDQSVMGSLPTGIPVERRDGDLYSKSVHGRWTVNCVHWSTRPSECHTSQVVTDTQGNRIARVIVFPVFDVSYIAAGATITLPLGTLLEFDFVLTIDGLAPKVYPIRYCVETGCIVRAGFTPEDLDQLRAGNQAVFTLYSVANPDEPVAGNVALEGFTDAFAEALETSSP